MHVCLQARMVINWYRVRVHLRRRHLADWDSPQTQLHRPHTSRWHSCLCGVHPLALFLCTALRYTVPYLCALVASVPHTASPSRRAHLQMADAHYS